VVISFKRWYFKEVNLRNEQYEPTIRKIVWGKYWRHKNSTSTEVEAFFEQPRKKPKRHSGVGSGALSVVDCISPARIKVLISESTAQIRERKRLVVLVVRRFLRRLIAHSATTTENASDLSVLLGIWVNPIPMYA